MTHARNRDDDALFTVMHAMETTVAATLDSYAGSMTFSQEKILSEILLISRQLNSLQTSC